MGKRKTIPIIVEETVGIERVGEPVTVGIPFPQGLLHDESRLSLTGRNGHPESLQTTTSARWPDQSIKWALLDFRADCLSYSASTYDLHIHGHLLSKECSLEGTVAFDDGATLKIDTGGASFVIDKRVFSPFKSVEIAGTELIDAGSSNIVLRDNSGRNYYPLIEKIIIENGGPLRSTVSVDGHFASHDGEVFSDFFARLSFYSGSGIVKLDFTIRNPKAAAHPGGLWDLGDEGSVYISDLSLNVALKEESAASIFWKTEINAAGKWSKGNAVEIYQDSSGGENWDSPNHVNKSGKVANSFRGYKVFTDDCEQEGDRATPIVSVVSGDKRITATIKNFWQNFPKAIKAGDNRLSIKLFPDRYHDDFELQGGEQKTHTVYMQYDSGSDEPVQLDWPQAPLIARTSSDWYAESMALGYMAPHDKDINPDYQQLVDNAISGNSSFFNIRETMDEYGWRNFGDVFANHEAVAYKGKLHPFVSHYNNQYDILNGCILQFARTGNARWYQLMDDLARHIIDIDIYYTKEDRPAFSGGHFWHTDHFMHAETSTHRSYSKKNSDPVGMHSYGGGPSTEHCYTTGLTAYYFLTGDVMAKQAVLLLAEWIMNIKNIQKSALGVIRKIKHEIDAFRNEYSNAPGRAEANSLNSLMDAFNLTGDRKYLQKAENIIGNYISPKDNIDKLNQQQIELRWFYLIFLQSLGKYLDIKDGIGERDVMFDYAKDSLMHHARWMLENEVPYKQLFHLVEIPSSTWPAHDIRKSAIFDFAYKYGEDQIKGEFKAKAEYFYSKSIEDVMSFEDGSLTFVRPLAILMHYGVMHTYFQNMTNEHRIDENT